MSSSGMDLMRKLGSLGAQTGAGAGAIAHGPTPKAAQPGGVAFESLLALARAGEADSDRAVSIDDGLGVTLSDSQARRLSRAADRAASEGFAVAVVHIDGQSLVLDVESRRVTGVLSDSRPVASEIDGVVFAPAEPAGLGENTAEAANTAPPAQAGMAGQIVRGAEALRLLRSPGALQAQARAFGAATSAA
ncbi:MAG: hypothetical protein JNK35_14565 [Phycisphaerae bacterium]|nr:hypothetical protein [Phycisphaerae bacterium]